MQWLRPPIRLDEHVSGEHSNPGRIGHNNLPVREPVYFVAAAAGLQHSRGPGGPGYFRNDCGGESTSSRLLSWNCCGLCFMATSSCGANGCQSLQEPSAKPMRI